MRKNIRKSQGFTLIELMIITAIIGVLSAIAIPYYRTYLLESRTAAMLATASTIQNAIAIKASRGDIDLAESAPTWIPLGYADETGPTTTANISAFELGEGHELTLTLSDNVSSTLTDTKIILTPVLKGDINIVWSTQVTGTGDDGSSLLSYIQSNFDVNAEGPAEDPDA